MSRRWIPLLILLVLLSIPARVATQPADIEKAIMEVVVLKQDAQQFARRGTAFHVGNGIFYTNAHVVKNPVPAGFTQWYLAGTTATRYTSSWLGPFTVTCVHPAWRDRGRELASPFDVAQIKVEGVEGLPSLPLAPGLPNTAMQVRIKGFPSASRAWPPILYTAEGRVSKLDLSDQNFEIDIESGFALGGSSGSPVLTGSKTVIGIVYGGAGIEGRTAGSIAAAITTQAIRSGCPVSERRGPQPVAAHQGPRPSGELGMIQRRI